MRAAIFVAFVVAMLFVGAVCDPLRAEFAEWASKHKRAYGSPLDSEHRFGIWKLNKELVDQHNKAFQLGHASYDLELNRFADLSWEEFKAHYLWNVPQDCSATGPKAPRAVSRPTFVDWRTKDVVTKVKDQGSCGSCWTFSTTGAVESHHAIKTGDLLYLSESQLVDCAGNFNNQGCRGGLPSQAFEYIHWAGGIEGESTYPYVPRDSKCTFDKASAIATVINSMNITEGDEEAQVDAIAEHGPVSIAYQVVSDFRFYKSGVYTSTACKNGSHDVNHAVLAVGYDTTTDKYGKPYYIVKNSWSATWGMNGYFLIELGKNMCGLAQCSAWPLV